MRTGTLAGSPATRRLLALAAVVALGAAGVMAQQNRDAVVVQSLHVQGNIWMLVGAGGNVTLSVGKDGVLVVDTQFADMSDRIIAEIRKIAGDRPIRYIVNTHAHGDHVGGNQAIAAAGAQIVAGNFAGQINFRTGGGNPAFIVAHENTLRHFEQPLQGESPAFEAWPTDVFFGRQKDFYFNGEPVVLLHQPNAHTDGDLFVHFRGSDVVATGDAYVNSSFPNLDVARGGSIQGYLAALNNLLDLMVPLDKQEAGTYAIPGHGRLADEADVLEFRDMVTIVRDRVQALIDQGMTEDQVVAARPARDYEGPYGNPENFIRRTYAGLKGS
ncbi:MAG: MBL fold metallo-hydrolase [Acidobacteria bacterium]|nr:MBL fold metallo-hydrolase [Acidobacteriota bacterium]